MQAVIDIWWSVDDGGWWAEAFNPETGKDIGADSGVVQTPGEAEKIARELCEQRGYEVVQARVNRSDEGV